MKFPMILAGIGTVLNIILDPIFIFTLNFGVSGAAWATTITVSYTHLTLPTILLV